MTLSTSYRRMLNKRSVIKEEEFTRFRAEIQKKHIDFLKKHRSVIITDYSEIIKNKSGIITTIPTLVTDIPPGVFSEEWTWDFDLKVSDYYNSRSLMKVMAVAI